jgi:hypothetical protein
METIDRLIMLALIGLIAAIGFGMIDKVDSNTLVLKERLEYMRVQHNKLVDVVRFYHEGGTHAVYRQGPAGRTE